MSTSYAVAFDRIGRSRSVSPLTVHAVRDADHLAEEIYQHARKYLLSRDVEVHVDIEAGTGTIFCGYQVGGSFTFAAIASEGDDEALLAIDGAAVPGDLLDGPGVAYHPEDPHAPKAGA